MNKITLSLLVLFFTSALLPVQAQQPDAHDELKTEINKMVENVKSADTAIEKREILNTSFDHLITAFNRVQAMESVPESDQEKIADFKKSILEKRNELNGKNGFKKVPNSQLNDFAQFVQQDIEQADRAVTISLTTALLIVIILLLL